MKKSRADRVLPPELEANKFKPGVSGNPGGRPKLLVALTPMVRAKLSEKQDDGRTLLDHILERMGKDALAGKEWAQRELMDRAFGRAVQHTELTGAGGGALVIEGVRASLKKKLLRLKAEDTEDVAEG